MNGAFLRMQRPISRANENAMLVSTAAVALAQADRILFKMCKHYALKVRVVFDAETAAIDFPYGRCQITRTDDVLRMRCEAESAEKLEKIQYVMDEHLALMARNKELVIDWQRA